MVDCARKLGVTFAALTPRKEVLLELPMWHHLGEDPTKKYINNNARCRCLRSNHYAFKMGHALTISSRLSTADHEANTNCLCLDCCKDRTIRGCKNPHGCAVTACTKLDKILPHWDPRLIVEDESSDSEEELDEDSDEIKIFRKPIRLDNLTDGFRIFTNQKIPAEEGDEAPPARNMNICSSTISYAGATTRKDGEIVSAGAGLWVTESDPSNISIKIPIATAQTRQGAEVIAALHAAQTSHRASDLHLESPRNFVAVSMTKNLRDGRTMAGSE
ncbi:hypothetical protein B0H13DRAFT_1671666 [Mycena leptocephala]|nr:hypothetical protein B0H13DRAFT_1671666 [Mycena leptocephala]